MWRKKPLSEAELIHLAENISDIEDEIEEPFVDSGSEYKETNTDNSSDETTRPSKSNKVKKQRKAAEKKQPQKYKKRKLEERKTNESSTESSSSDKSEEDTESETDEELPMKMIDEWMAVHKNFKPRKNIPKELPPTILANLDRSSSEIDVFFKLFPKSLFMWIAEKTNERLEILKERKKNISAHPTDQYEIMIVVGCFFIMAYNRVPAQRHYWSTNSSLGNNMIKHSISRNRFQLLSSKIYFNSPEKPENANKLYYVEELVSCFKHTFQQARSESTFQSIDEAMAKFKGRSSLKQYLPLKPIKRGVKLWVRCDSKTGYTYDFNIYAGKDADRDKDTTVGEAVVMKLAATIRDPNVSLCFDRFFTSTRLMNELPFSAVGTVISTRKNMPDFLIDKKRNRGDAQFLCNQHGTCAVSWKDTKDVTMLSNCHGSQMTAINRKVKDGSKAEIGCPIMVEHYNNYMGGVDLSDQLVGMYDIDRKSSKWWKKVFYRLLMTTAVNAWIIFCETKGRQGKERKPFLNFLVPLAESLLSYGRQHANVIRKRQYGRPSSGSKLLNIGDHLPLEGPTRRRCYNCTKKKKETRTTTLCAACNIPLCKNCFTNYHT